MSRVEIKGGAIFDLLSPKESEDQHNKTRLQLSKLVKAPPALIWHPSSFATDSSGNIGGGLAGNGQAVYRCPVGMRADLHRLVIEVDGHGPDSPLTSGSARFSRNSTGPGSSVGWFLPQSTQVSPVTFVEGDGAPTLVAGDRLIMAGAGFPVSTGVHLMILVRLWPVEPTVVATSAEG